MKAFDKKQVTRQRSNNRPIGVLYPDCQHHFEKWLQVQEWAAASAL